MNQEVQVKELVLNAIRHNVDRHLSVDLPMTELVSYVVQESDRMCISLRNTVYGLEKDLHGGLKKAE